MSDVVSQVFAENHQNPDRADGKVTIVMPAFNAAKTIAAAVRSILGQTYADFNLVICDDCSTDETSKRLAEIHDPRVECFRNESNLGPGLSRDLCIERAVGKWVAFTDADDIWDRSRLAALMDCATRNQDAIIFDDLMLCHHTGRGIRPWKVLRGEKAFGTDQRSCGEIDVSIYVTAPQLLIKPLVPLCLIREHRVRHCRRMVHEDNLFFLRLLIHGAKPVYLPKALYFYRITPGSLAAQTDRNRVFLEVLDVAAQEARHLPDLSNALARKRGSVERDERYFCFVVELKRREFARALTMLVRNPRLGWEFTVRFPATVGYHVSRVWHGGVRRGLR